jgi:hypothetical protein
MDAKDFPKPHPLYLSQSRVRGPYSFPYLSQNLGQELPTRLKNMNWELSRLTEVC